MNSPFPAAAGSLSTCARPALLVAALFLAVGPTGGCSKGPDKASAPKSAATVAAGPSLVIKTSKGTIEVELYPDKAPATVKNFLDYVDAGHYDGTIFHRVIKDFMIQGGGFVPDGQQKPTKPPVKNEATNGLKNTRGTNPLSILSPLFDKESGALASGATRVRLEPLKVRGKLVLLEQPGAQPGNELLSIERTRVSNG